MPRTALYHREDSFESNYKKQEKIEPKQEKRQFLPTPKELALQASEIANERYKWEKFR